MIRIIKNRTSSNTTNASNNRVEKTESQSQRDTATIVKGWILQWQQRRRIRNAHRRQLNPSTAQLAPAKLPTRSCLCNLCALGKGQ